MSATGTRRPPAPTRTLCLGDALVDLICERPVAEVGDAQEFRPHFGGVVANVAVVAARNGARVALAGGAGDDPWGRWLRDRLELEGVETSLFALRRGVQTALAVVLVGPDGEAGYTVYGSEVGLAALGRKLEDAVEQSAGLFLTSNSLAGAEERELAMRARERALELGRPVVFEANLRLHRWRSQADAAASANGCVSGALLVRVNELEAAIMTGEDDPERAAGALLKAGAQMVVLTRGSGGAILRGRLRSDARAPATQPLSTVGAGDVLTGVLLARLALSRFYPPAVAAALPEAVAAAARACERWGALD